MEYSLMIVKRTVMIMQGNMGQKILTRDNHKVSTTHFKDSSEEVISSKDSMAKINGNRARTNHRITTKIKLATSTIRKMINLLDRKHQKNKQGELRKLSITFSKMRMQTQGITKNIMRRCLGESKKDKKRINNTGMNFEKSMKRDSVKMAQCSMTIIIQCSRLLVS
jgi:hypothetical protein